MIERPFVGYPGRVWAVSYIALTWLAEQMAASSAPAKLEDPVEVVFATLWNGLKALSTYQAGTALAGEVQALIGVQVLPLTLNPVTTQFLTARVASITQASTEITALVPAINVFTVRDTLERGLPAIDDPLFLEWCMTFSGETPPAGMVLPDDAVTAANAWLDIANSIFVIQGTTPLVAYDAALRQYNAATTIATVLSQLQSGSFANAGPANAATWSSVVALPTMLLDAAMISSGPASLASQQSSLIRFILMRQLQKLANLLLSFRSHHVVAPTTATLHMGESLMDLAARTTGDFENWQSVAELNSLRPPYPSSADRSLALTGRKLFISGTGINAEVSRQPSYDVNVLGRDWDFGGINTEMPPWRGDIPMIRGFLNYARAIGRRLQTPLASLIYHRTYGCSIPAEIGAVQSVDEADKITAYGRAAINADPRTGSIKAASTVIRPGFEANFSASISPIGPGSNSVSIAEIIGASPT